MKSLLSFLFVLVICVATAQPVKLELLPFKNDMIGRQYYKGTIVQGKKWKDSKGINILVLTTAEVKYEKTQQGEFGDEDGKTELYAYHFILKDTPQLQWKIYDFVGWCGLDVICEFYKNSLTITDLDNDGEAESTFLYAQACKGDVSPNGKKLIMHEGITKYAIRGASLLEMNKEKMGGEKRPDAAFATAPKAFVDYANKQWGKFGLVKY